MERLVLAMSEVFLRRSKGLLIDDELHCPQLLPVNGKW